MDLQRLYFALAPLEFDQFLDLCLDEATYLIRYTVAHRGGGQRIERDEALKTGGRFLLWNETRAGSPRGEVAEGQPSFPNAILLGFHQKHQAFDGSIQLRELVKTATSDYEPPPGWLIDQFNRSGDGSMVVPGEYLEIVITRH